jgi:elongation factor G
MGHIGADFFGAISGIKEKLRGNAHPIFLNIGSGENFKGLILFCASLDPCTTN